MSFRSEMPAGASSMTVRGEDGRTMLYSGQVMLKAGETKNLTIGTK